jgi:hypothetical protein
MEREEGAVHNIQSTDGVTTDKAVNLIDSLCSKADGCINLSRTAPEVLKRQQ